MARTSGTIMPLLFMLLFFGSAIGVMARAL
jgi:hypothetical protein